MGPPTIADKVTVITGASSGIGESMARLLARHGAKVVLGARRKDRIDAVVKELAAKGGNALGFKTDVTKRGDVEALLRGAMDRHDRIDVIVNNSGIMPIAPMAALKAEEWGRMIDVNIKGLLYGVAAVLPGAVATRFLAWLSARRNRPNGVIARRHCRRSNPGQQHVACHWLASLRSQ